MSVYHVALREEDLDVRSFRALLPSDRERLMILAANRLPWRNNLVTFVCQTHTATGEPRLAATVRLIDHHPCGGDEYVTYAVCFGKRVYFDEGHYGFRSEKEAISDMYRRTLA
jgi:hypothetical protein